MDNSQIPFFGEYTNHGVRHINEVLQTATSLITDEAWNKLTPEDAATLIVAILLHDLGMHITEEGFIGLLSSDQIMTDYDKSTWQQLWIDFLEEAKRFDEKKVYSLFGEEYSVKPPVENHKNWSLFDKMLIGEFLRRHHPRLAHEISHFGFPAPKGHESPLRFVGIPQYIAEFGGKIARSHGQELRDALEYINYEDRRDYKGIHAPYLMAIVRIADYMQVQRERASGQILQIKNLSSPLSRAEWRVHDSIDDIKTINEDPEAIKINAKPKDVTTFLKLKSLFKGIQYELDTSWAALGEIYGRYEELLPLGLSGLSIRRIRSNLDNLAQFEETVSYVPMEIKLKTANAELLNLLISPLYGKVPSIGLREMLQNAVDARRELVDHVKRAQIDITLVEPNGGNFDIEIKTYVDEESNRWLLIKDRGIGMTKEIIDQYFLNVGASFRNSDSWHKMHDSPDGSNSVYRSGRFGVGVLAAFLLGPEIRVKTRHISQRRDQALEFSLTNGDAYIELKKINADIGTEIAIKITDDLVWRQLLEVPLRNSELSSSGNDSWIWYFNNNPSVAWFSEEGVPYTIGQTAPDKTVPSERDSNPPLWRTINTKDYPKIHWTHHHRDGLIVNGFAVFSTNGYSISFPDYELPNHPSPSSQHFFAFKKPRLAIYDPLGRMPLNLQRSALTGSRLPFEQDLVQSIALNMIAHAIVNVPSYEEMVAFLESGTSKLIYPGVRYGRRYQRIDFSFHPFWISKSGFGFMDPAVIALSPLRLFIVVSRSAIRNILNVVGDDAMITPISRNYAFARNMSFVKYMLYGDLADAFSGPYAPVNSIRGILILVPGYVFHQLNKKGGMRREIKDQITTRRFNNGYIAIIRGSVTIEDEKLIEIVSHLNAEEEEIFAMSILNPIVQSDLRLSNFFNAYRSTMKALVIPHHKKDRMLLVSSTDLEAAVNLFESESGLVDLNGNTEELDEENEDSIESSES
ncbi:ATP-binding protein [Deinococcus multiflagellatus]|uniref:ATP-binding protein n=1 Tax=Deinococcus multiflagellatus TaxID=1656887 RepID=A0ABW1ZFX5_9DEIO